MVDIEKKKKRILVAGDAMLDAYHFGEVNRISPEAPVPVFLETGRKRFVPGGAANVAVNIAAIGQDVSFCAIMGDDANGETFLKLMEENNVNTELVQRFGARKTVTKLRYIGPGNQQILRVDDEDIGEVTVSDIKPILERLETKTNQYDVIVLSDYRKGFLSEEITKYLIGLAHKNDIPVLVDVKDTMFSKYGGATVLKPNRRELKQLSGMSVDSVEEIVSAAKFLCKNIPCEYVLATLGAEGMLLANQNGLIRHIGSVASEVFDVTGAGDTSIAYLASEIAGGKDIEEAMTVANFAAGIQVSKLGTSVVYPYEVYDAMKKAGVSNEMESGADLSDKIESIRLRKKHGEKIVFTNGCFDILHTGHVTYLREAKKMGDILVIGLNSDASVRRLKGSGRPVNSLRDREMMLQALNFVDYVIPFEEDTPKHLIEKIMPDVLVKGGDYVPESIVGAETVLQNGGMVKVISLVPGHSTTEIIKKIQEGDTGYV